MHVLGLLGGKQQNIECLNIHGTVQLKVDSSLLVSGLLEVPTYVKICEIEDLT